MAVCAKYSLELPLGGMDLEQTLFCGQSFSWQRGEADEYVGVAGRRAVAVRQSGEALLLCRLDGTPPSGEDAAFWRHYFALDVDYAVLKACFCADSTLAACVAFAPGMRVLRQPFFDTLLAFIISQNNHIQRIAGIVQRLCRLAGEALPGGAYAFPAPEKLAAMCPEDLAPLRAGFRARYLVDAAQKVAGGQVTEDALRALDDKGASALLQRITGVGPKVADCVLLFALGRSSAVPADVWMRRALRQVFPQGMPACTAGHEGIAQQFIFHWARANLKPGS